MKEKMVPIVIALLLILGCLFLGIAAAAAAEPASTSKGVAPSGVRAESIIINHTCTNRSQIPEVWISAAKEHLHIAYGHTSHGSQLITGMEGLDAFLGNTSLFVWNDGPLAGYLDLDDYAFDEYGAYDLGNPDLTAWLQATRDYLNDSDHSDVNVVVWSWCGQLSGMSSADVTAYLNNMALLEGEYPTINFVYMTGHLNIWDWTTTTTNNQQIRDYCMANNKILYDFADIESYDPDGVFYEYANDDCAYYDDQLGSNMLGNWAQEWQSNHTEGAGGAWYDCGYSDCCAHSEPLNCNQKAYAAWWLWARLAGWGDGGAPPTPELCSFDTGPGTFPSISGTHTGTITPSCTLTISELYTYPCPGTGGHTESIALYNSSEPLANGTWNGYVGDWHNLTITPQVTLEKDHEYRYVIKTGAYPQLHHRAAVQTAAGWLNCTAFTDVNGKLHDPWVPAIQLIGSAANETPAGLVQPSDLAYVGAFRLPGGEEPPQTFAYGGNAMSFNPDGDSTNTDPYPGSLFVMGHDRQAWGDLPDGNQVAELAIPVPVNSSNLDDLPYATFIQGFHDVAAGYFHELDEVPKVGMQYLNNPDTGPKIHLCWGRHLQQLEDGIPSHAWINATLVTPGLKGVWFIGNQNPNSVNGYMFDIPAAWADAHAQGRYLATGRVHGGGLGGMGPALFAYRPWLAGGAAPVNGTHLAETTLLLYENAYNTEEITRCMAGYQHPDEWEGGAWLSTPSGKSAVLFAGTKSTGTKYWYGYRNPSGPQYPCVDTEVTDFVTCRLANGTPCPPGDFAGCCDGASGNCSSLRGWWSTRFDAQLILYDPADLARVAAGTVNSWEPQPYATIDIDDRLYFNPPEWDEPNLGTGDQRRYRIGDATYDREQSILYVLELYGDGAKPVVHVWRVQ
jgi:hypothetical protein